VTAGNDVAMRTLRPEAPTDPARPGPQLLIAEFRYRFSPGWLNHRLQMEGPAADRRTRSNSVFCQRCPARKQWNLLSILSAHRLRHHPSATSRPAASMANLWLW
jgi:hypothetical protein